MFLDLSKLDHLFVGVALVELLELGKTLDVSTLDTSEISATTHLWNDAGALYALGKTANHVRTAFVVIFCYFNIGSHMWA